MTASSSYDPVTAYNPTQFSPHGPGASLNQQNIRLLRRAHDLAQSTAALAVAAIPDVPAAAVADARAVAEEGAALFAFVASPLPTADGVPR